MATDFVKEQYSQSEEYDLRFNELIGFDNRKKRVSVAFITPSTVNAVQFLSGGTFYYFKSRIMNTSGDFELLGDYTPLNKKLALYDDATDVYGENRAALDEYLSLLNSRLSDPPIPWSQRDRIKTLIS